LVARIAPAGSLKLKLISLKGELKTDHLNIYPTGAYYTELGLGDAFTAIYLQAFLFTRSTK
jgi:hypothetical protein